MNYVFFEGDLEIDELYDIHGDDYRELIKKCFQYSEYFSVWFSPHVLWTEKLKPYEITVDPACFEYAPPNGPTPENKGDIMIYLHFYCICPGLYQILIENMHGIWDGWNFDQPAYMHFYRSDGTCFFMSDTHDSRCFFYAREGEDISSVVSKEHWYREEDLWPSVIDSPRPRVYRPLIQENLLDT